MLLHSFKGREYFRYITGYAYSERRSPGVTFSRLIFLFAGIDEGGLCMVFDKIKKESPYREVLWGAGNCFVANVDMLRFFDQIILIDSRKNPRQSIFCDRLERVLNINQEEPQIWQRIYREDILDGTAWKERAERTDFTPDGWKNIICQR